jgi:hypothetical protein
MWMKRAADLIAAFVLGNGVLDLIAPRRRVFLWIFGPEALRKLTVWFADHPTAMRLRGMVRIGSGIWLAQGSTGKPPNLPPGTNAGPPGTAWRNTARRDYCWHP